MLSKYLYNMFEAVTKFLRRLNIPGGLKLWVTLFCIIFLGNSIFNNYGKISEQTIDIGTFFILFAGLLVSLLSLVVNAIAWKSIIQWLGYKNENLDLIILFLTSNLLKYLPGGVWHFVERIRLLKKNVDPEKAFISVLIEPFFMIVGALFWVALGRFHVWISIACLLPFLAFMRGGRKSLIIQLNRIKFSLIQRTKNKGLLEDYEMNINSFSHEYPFFPLSMEIFFIALRFGAFWLCLSAFSLENIFDIFYWCGLFSVAWIIGLVVPSAPGGVGIFEAFLLLIIGSEVSESGLISALLFYRFIVSAADLIAALLAQYFKSNSGLSLNSD